MKIIIVGAGVIGSNLAEFLTKENHEVYLVEKNEDRAAKIHEKLDVKVVVGDGAQPQVLKRAGVDTADLVVAVTTSDEANLVVCSLAAASGAKHRIARVRNQELSQELNTFARPYFHFDEIIHPEQLAAESILKTIATPGAREVADFAEGKILLRSFSVPEDSPLCQLSIAEVSQEDFPWPFLVTFILRSGQVLVPKGQTSIMAQDRIYVLLPAASLGEFLSFVDPNTRMPKKVVISGASDIGVRVAKALSVQMRDLVLLEENPVLAEAAARQLHGVRIINGSAGETDILIESGIEATDVFIAASRDDPSNLISAVLAKKMGAGSAIITTQQPDFLSIIDALDIDAIINPRLLAVQQILRLVRGKGVQAMTKLLDCRAEALEWVPEQGSRITAGPIKNISFPKEAIVGAVLDGQDVVLVNGETQIYPGQRVIVFCQEPAVPKLHRLFVRKKFL